MYNQDNYPFRLLANCFQFFCRDSAVFIFPTLLADLKDPIQNRDSVPTLWAEFERVNQAIYSAFARCLGLELIGSILGPTPSHNFISHNSNQRLFLLRS